MHRKVLLFGSAVIGLLGVTYSIRSCAYYKNKLDSLEKKLDSFEYDKEKKIDLSYLIEYLKENREKEFYGVKEKSNFEKLWESLSSETKWTILKEIGANKAKDAYSGLKEKTVDGYNELKEFFNKKVINNGHN